MLASSWLDEDWELDAFLEQTGLDDLGVDAGLRTEVCAEVLNSLSRRLAKAQLGAEQLDARLRILERPNGGVLTDALQVESAHALLGPYSEGDPPEDIKAVVRRFLLRAIGDPRMQPGAWNPVNMADRRVMLRWMVAETLEDFFRLLDRTALDRHWAQRKAFWSVYLDLGVITDAWLVLGQHARQRGRGVLGAAGGTYGLLGKGGDYSQSVLLMRLAGITIAEWSHNGKCRMWLEGSRSAPTLYQRLYKRTQLASDSCEEAVIHDAYGRWKDHIARFIYRQTGIVWRG